MSPAGHGLNAYCVSGVLCEIDITRQPCEPNPCEGGAECAVLPEAQFACRCPVGRDGDRCEKGMVLRQDKKQNSISD